MRKVAASDVCGVRQGNEKGMIRKHIGRDRPPVDIRTVALHGIFTKGRKKVFSVLVI